MAILLILLFSMLNSYASSEQSCRLATSTLEMVKCLQDALQENEKSLQDLEQSISATLDAGQQLLFKQTQLAWTSYRFANCNAAMALFEGGTMAPIVFVQCKVDMTRQRIDIIDSLYDAGGQQ